MGEHSIQTLRADIRGQLKKLEREGLGSISGTKRRDTFVLDANHPGAVALTTKAGIHENFIRSEDGGLLFRDPAPSFTEAIGALQRRASPDRSKGIEFLWSSIDKPEIRELFAALRRTAGLPS